MIKNRISFYFIHCLVTVFVGCLFNFASTSVSFKVNVKPYNPLHHPPKKKIDFDTSDLPTAREYQVAAGWSTSSYDSGIKDYGILWQSRETYNYKNIARINGMKLSVIQKYKDSLENEERAFMKDFFESFGITQKEWKAFTKTCEQDFLKGQDKYKDTLTCHNYQSIFGRIAKKVGSLFGLKDTTSKLSAKLKALASKTLKDGFLSKSVEIIAHASNDEYQFDVVTLRSLMIINEKRFNKMHPEEDQATAKLWHEIMHIYHDDSFTDFCLRDLKNKVASGNSYINWFNIGWLGNLIKKIRERFNEDKWNITYKKWTLFIERRADILSGLISPQIATAWVRMLTNYVKRYTDFPGGDHPTGSERLAYMTKLRDELIT